MTTTQEPIYNEYTVKKFIHLCSFGLVKGLGEPIEGKMCVEAAIALAHNLPHQDENPQCVGEKVAKFKINLNDCSWSTNEARAKGIIAIGIAQLGSNTLDQEVFCERLLLNSTRLILPFLIQTHYDSMEDKKKAAKLLEYKKQFSELNKLDDALWKEFYNYYYYNDYNYNYYYNYYNNYYNDYNYNYYYYNIKNDSFLLICSQAILQTLKDLNSPGCQFLHLCPKGTYPV